MFSPNGKLIYAVRQTGILDCSVAAAGKRRTRRTQIPVSRTALVSYQTVVDLDAEAAAVSAIASGPRQSTMSAINHRIADSWSSTPNTAAT